jgi:flagellar assembly protein FliH
MSSTLSTLATRAARQANTVSANTPLISPAQNAAYPNWKLNSFAQPNSASATAPIVDAQTIKEIQQQAHTEGFNAGQAEGHLLGHAAGYAAGVQQAQTEATQLNTLMQSMQASLNELDQQLAQSLLDLALEVARKMVLETLQVKPELILGIVNEAIGSLPHFNQNAHLILHPDDALLVRTQLGEQLTHGGWKIFDDAKIERGGCRIETSHSHIDATNEDRWQHIVDSIGQDKSWRN